MDNISDVELALNLLTSARRQNNPLILDVGNDSDSPWERDLIEYPSSESIPLSPARDADHLSSGRTHNTSIAYSYVGPGHHCEFEVTHLLLACFPSHSR